MPAPKHAKLPDSPAAPAQQAFVAELERNQAALYAFVRHLVNDAEEARDIVQETFVAAWRATLHEQAPFTSDGAENEVRRWLFQVAYRRTISVWRHRAVVTWHSFDAADPPEPPDYARPAPFEDRLAEEDSIRGALARLDPDDVACIVLAVIQQFTAAEMAQILAISAAAARQRLSRALRRLRAAYFAQEAEDNPAFPEQIAEQRPEEKIGK